MKEGEGEGGGRRESERERGGGRGMNTESERGVIEEVGIGQRIMDGSRVMKVSGHSANLQRS